MYSMCAELSICDVVPIIVSTAMELVIILVEGALWKSK